MLPRGSIWRQASSGLRLWRVHSGCVHQHKPLVGGRKGTAGDGSVGFYVWDQATAVRWPNGRPGDHVARLKDGISIEAAAAGMEVIARQLQSQYPGTNREFANATIVPLRDIIVGEVRRILLVLLAGAGILLLIAWVNVTTLLLV